MRWTIEPSGDSNISTLNHRPQESTYNKIITIIKLYLLMLSTGNVHNRRANQSCGCGGESLSNDREMSEPASTLQDEHRALLVEKANWEKGMKVPKGRVNKMEGGITMSK